MFWKTAKIFLLVALSAACQPSPEIIEQEIVQFGTRIKITVNDAERQRAAAAIDEVFTHFAAMHRRFHPWRDGELMRLNRRIAADALPVTVSPPMRAMIEQGRDYAERSEGLFNPAIGALVRLWGFHADTPPSEPPPPDTIRALLAAGGTNMAQMMLQDNLLQSAPVEIQLDFGALAKGVALDDAGAILKSHKITSALVNIGGNIIALGMNGDKPWRVALSPDRQEPPVAIVELYDGEAVALSGGSERYFIHQGQRYHHIIDPRTGYPAPATAAAVVIAGSQSAGAVSDAAATALVIADDETAARLLPRFGITLAWRQGHEPTAAMQERMLKQ